MKSIKFLSYEQETALLNYLAEDYEVINSGASRICFVGTEKAFQTAKIELSPRKKKYVIKVAIGIAGINQNRIETEAYRRYGDKSPLAEIAYAGHYVEIMEQVSLLGDEFREYDGYSEEEFIEYATDNDIPEDLARAGYEVATALEEINGTTGDNGQLGMNADGEIVAYDYGFEVDSDDELCSDLSYTCAFDKALESGRYLRGLAKLVAEEQENIGTFETALLNEDDDDDDIEDVEVIKGDNK